MDNFIDYIEVSNFKSIRNLELTGFKRINLLLGRPNVGKSNLLEALSLFSIPYVWESPPRRLTEIIRLKSQTDLFYEANFSISAFIRVGGSDKEKILENCYVDFNRETGGLNIDVFVSRPYSNSLLVEEHRSRSGFFLDNNYLVKYEVDQKFKLTDYFGTQSRGFINHVKRYTFNPDIKYKEHRIPFLHPPFGNNLLYVLELMPELRQQYAQWFRQYGLRLERVGELKKVGSRGIFVATKRQNDDQTVLETDRLPVGHNIALFQP